MGDGKLSVEIGQKAIRCSQCNEPFVTGAHTRIKVCDTCKALNRGAGQKKRRQTLKTRRLERGSRAF